MVAGLPAIVLEHINRMHPDVAPRWPSAAMADGLASTRVDHGAAREHAVRS